MKRLLTVLNWMAFAVWTCISLFVGLMVMAYALDQFIRDKTIANGWALVTVLFYAIPVLLFLHARRQANWRSSLVGLGFSSLAVGLMALGLGRSTDPEMYGWLIFLLLLMFIDRHVIDPEKSAQQK